VKACTDPRPLYDSAPSLPSVPFSQLFPPARRCPTRDPSQPLGPAGSGLRARTPASQAALHPRVKSIISSDITGGYSGARLCKYSSSQRLQLGRRRSQSHRSLGHARCFPRGICSRSQKGCTLERLPNFQTHRLSPATSALPAMRDAMRRATWGATRGALPAPSPMGSALAPVPAAAWLAPLCPASALCHQAWPRPVVVPVTSPCARRCPASEPAPASASPPAPGGTLPAARRGWSAPALGGPSCGSPQHPLLPGQLGALHSCLLLLHPCKPSPSRSTSSAVGRAPSPKQGKRGAQPPTPSERRWRPPPSPNKASPRLMGASARSPQHPPHPRERLGAGADAEQGTEPQPCPRIRGGLGVSAGRAARRAQSEQCPRVRRL